MPKRIDTLTDNQRDQMGAFAQSWIERGWRTQPLTDDEWAAWRSGAERCYEYAGIPFPTTVVRVPSPLVGALAAPIAAYLIALLKGDAVGGAVRGAVGVAVDDAVRQTIKNLWYWRLGGVHWADWYQAYVAYFRDVAELQLDGDLWDRSRAYEDAMSAGWWWPFRDFVMVCDVPHTLHLEQVGPTGWGSHRLHCDDGPAVAWEGMLLNYWHGIHVPNDFFAWDLDRALKEPNTEIRRCAVEMIGLDKLVDRMTLITECEDPGNAPHTLALYDLPADLRDLYGGTRVRVLVMRNASLDKGGHLRQFAETVPATIKDPIEAVAWQFGVPTAAYRGLVRAS